VLLAILLKKMWKFCVWFISILNYKSIRLQGRLSWGARRAIAHLWKYWGPYIFPKILIVICELLIELIIFLLK
jgi:hypothetical protein